MKKRVLMLALASSAMILSGCSNIVPHSSEDEQLVPNELLEEDNKNKDYVSPKHGKKYAKDEDEAYIFPDKIALHYHRDDGDYENRRFWMWTKSSAPEVEFDMVPEKDPWSQVFEFSPAELFESKVDDGFSFMVKLHDSWGGKSAEIPIFYKEYEPKKQADGTYKLDLYIIQIGAALQIFKSKEDALSDQISDAFISGEGTDKFKKINIYTKDGDDDGKSVIKNLRIYKFNKYYENLSDSLKETLKEDYLIFSADNVNKEKIAVKFSKTLTINCKYVVEASFFGPKPDVYSKYTINYFNLYDTEEFQSLNYDGNDLGATVDAKNNKTTFKVWAPTASSIQLKVYDRGYPSQFLPEDKYFDTNEQSLCDTYTYYDMNLNLNTAVWETTIDENLEGKYYTYKVKNTYGINDVVDPYAKSCGMKGLRGMIIDLNNPNTKPTGWDELPTKWDGVEGYDITTPQELTVSEVHIRDLTASKTWYGTGDKAKYEPLQGTFKGFIEGGTKYNTVKTGYDHLVEYGVNALQILPVFDFDNGERGVKEIAVPNSKTGETIKVTDYTALDEYNWGYNPLNYNCVEGAYSSDPRDGLARVKEYRELIHKFATNENHTRIIMDVVYNHVSSAPTSSFERLMPKYYFRFKNTGEYSDASGCGNEVKTEAPMMSKFIVDSLVHWAVDYKVKGFRFDLMGALDVVTLAKVADALYEIDPDIVLYGEGWHSSEAPQLPLELRAINTNIAANLGPDRSNAVPQIKELAAKGHARGIVGGFNNGLRDKLKGDNDINNSGAFRGFIGGSGDDDKLRAAKGLLGGNGNDNHSMIPQQNISYVSCHDNYSLFDQLNWLLGRASDDEKKNNPDLEPNLNLVAKTSAAVNGMVMMSNGIAFIQGGEEIFRTKIETLENPNKQDLTYETKMYGKRISHNSYKSSDFTNAYDYARKEELKPYFDYYCKLVDLRKNLKFSQTIVDGNTLTSGVEAQIEKGNTGQQILGLYRQCKDGTAYHCYLTAKTGAKINAPGTEILGMSKVVGTGNEKDIQSNFSLTILLEGGK